MKHHPGQFVAIIPARKGSKRLPGKNLLPLSGKPLIEWTINAALEAGLFDQIIVTSDDQDILTKAKSSGVISILRPKELASDTATTVDTVLHALDSALPSGNSSNRFMLLQPTSPLRTADDIVQASEIMYDADSDSVISVCPAEHPPQWYGKLGVNGSMTSFLQYDPVHMRSQDLGGYYRLNGAIYCANTIEFRSKKSFFLPNSHAYVMPIERSVDIDSEFDLFIAEAILSRESATMHSGHQ
ncbi:MAG: cytidylyltransferase domain-containing protein [bacterium]